MLHGLQVIDGTAVGIQWLGFTAGMAFNPWVPRLLWQSEFGLHPFSYTQALDFIAFLAQATWVSEATTN